MAQCPVSHHMGTRDGTQVISLGGKHFYLPPDSFYQPLKFLLHLFICVCWGGVVWCACVTVPIWRPGDDL